LVSKNRGPAELIASCKKIEEKISDSFLKLIEIVKELEGPPLIRESTLLTKEQLESELNILKISWGSEFDNLTSFPEEEIK
jgi:hypothetical protein